MESADPEPHDVGSIDERLRAEASVRVHQGPP
jgi:hypothetical protein